MALHYLVKRTVYGVPGIVGSLLNVRRSLTHRVLVVAVERCPVDDIDGQFLRIPYHQRGVGGLELCALVGIGTQNGAEVHLLLWVAKGMARHHQLSRLPICRRHLYAMWNQ